MPTRGKIEVQGKGTIEFELFDETPNTTKNFVSLAKKGFYDGVTFHRVVDDFVVQGGDPYSKTNEGPVGTGGPGYKIACETDAAKQVHNNGSFSMAHAGTDTGGSQFFIVLNGDNCSHLNGKHTVFGKTTKGMDVVNTINQGDVMEKVEILETSPKIESKNLETL